MAITNGYCTLAEIKARIRITDTADDTALELAVESASRAIDHHCTRRFYLDAATSARTYNVPRGGVLLGDTLCIDDYDPATTPTVKVDDNDDGVYETTLVAATDYVAEPLNASNVEPGPKNELRFLSRAVQQSLTGRAEVQVTAKWGWPSVPTAVKQACETIAIDLFKAKDAPFGVAGSSDFGTLRIRSDIAAHAAMLLRTYRRHVHGIG